MTNEELLFEFAHELRNGGQYEVASNRAVELRAELLRRLAVSASSQDEFRDIANELAEAVLEKTPRMNNLATWPGTITIASAIVEGMKRVSVSASPTLPDMCECGHKWHGDDPCQWKGREEDMELHCTCPESHRTLTSKDFQSVSASPQPRCPKCGGELKDGKERGEIYCVKCEDAWDLVGIESLYQFFAAAPARKHCTAGEDHLIHHAGKGFKNAHKFEPVAEPASTGEPKVFCTICGVESGIKHGHAGHTFQPPAARPSEPSAPQPNVMHRSFNYQGETLASKRPAPHTSAEREKK